jgi:hypothetical protein
VTDGEPTLLRDGDAAVRVGYVRRGGSTSVKLTDAASGAAITLDATELESLARAPEALLRDLLRGGEH